MTNPLAISVADSEATARTGAAATTYAGVRMAPRRWLLNSSGMSPQPLNSLVWPVPLLLLLCCALGSALPAKASAQYRAMIVEVSAGQARAQLPAGEIDRGGAAVKAGDLVQADGVTIGRVIQVALPSLTFQRQTQLEVGDMVAVQRESPQGSQAVIPDNPYPPAPPMDAPTVDEPLAEPSGWAVGRRQDLPISGGAAWGRGRRADMIDPCGAPQAQAYGAVEQALAALDRSALDTGLQKIRMDCPDSADFLQQLRAHLSSLSQRQIQANTQAMAAAAEGNQVRRAVNISAAIGLLRGFVDLQAGSNAP